MKRRSCLTAAGGIAAIIYLLFLSGTVLGYDLTDTFSIGGVIAGTYQYQWVNGDDYLGRGVLPFQPEFSFRPTEHDEFFTNL